MKNTITSLLLFLTILSGTSVAQNNESAVTGASYANNVWFSLENGSVATASATNWDIAFAASASQNGGLTASIHHNPKQGILCVAPVTVANFSSLDTTGMTWTPLYNSDQTWASGAFNQPSTGGLDYGFGAYNMGTHNVQANRVFVTRKGTPGAYECIKLYITLNSIQGTYTLTYDKLDNSNLQTKTLTIADYSTKNFFYYSLNTHAIVDREPASTTWDLLFTQYVSTSELYGSASNQTVTGVLSNHGVKVAQANNVENASTYEDYTALEFSSHINTIGFDWKKLNYADFGWQTVTDTVYFVKQTDNDVYKVVFTGFTGSSTGTYEFTTEKLSTTTGLFGSNGYKASLSVYPNPVEGGSATLVYDFNTSANALITIADLSGNILQTEKFNSMAGFNSYNISTASLQPGLYILSVNVNDAVLSQKLVIK